MVIITSVSNRNQRIAKTYYAFLSLVYFTCIAVSGVVVQINLVMDKVVVIGCLVVKVSVVLTIFALLKDH